MTFFQLLPAFFYLQPSLIISFVPVQFTLLFICLRIYKKISILKAVFHAFIATVFATVIIFLVGSFVVPFVHLNFFQLVGISIATSVGLLFASTFVYWLIIRFYLRYVVSMEDITHLSGLSSAIAGLSVVVFYYLLWR